MDFSIRQTKQAKMMEVRRRRRENEKNREREKKHYSPYSHRRYGESERMTFFVAPNRIVAKCSMCILYKMRMVLRLIER